MTIAVDLGRKATKTNKQTNKQNLHVVLTVYSISIYCVLILNGPRREKTCLRGFRQTEIQTSLLSYRN